jgi:multiple sugar transport system permease protein
MYRMKLGTRIPLFFALVIFTFLMLFPFAWMVTTSFKPGNDIYIAGKSPFAMSGVTLEHYYLLLTETKFLRWMLNSLVVALAASAISIITGIMAAYAIGRLRFAGAAIIALAIFSTYLVPPALLFIPLNVVVNTLGLSNSLYAMMVTYLTFMVPFIAWMLASYFKGIPYELAEAARIDGASRIKAMMVIDLPLILPGVVSVFFFAFTLSWTEYLYATTFIRTGSKLPVAVGVVNAMQIGDVYFWGQLMAGALLGSLPVVIIYSFLMDYYLAGLTAGAVKG